MIGKRYQWRSLHVLWCVGLVCSLIASLAGCACPDDGNNTNAPGKLATDQPGDTVLFDNVRIGETQSKPFILFNDGATELTVSALEIVDDEGKVFAIKDPPAVPFVLPPNGKQGGKKITVEFLPQKAASFTAKLRIQSSDADNVDGGGYFFVNLRHQNLSPDPVFVCGGTLNFGSVEKGKSVTQECVIKNRGNADLEITGITYEKEKGGEAQDFKWESPTLPARVPAGSEDGITIKITYTPSDYPPNEDQGAFLLDTNLQIERPADRPRIKVVGVTAVALIELIPLYPPCDIAQNNTDCRNIDSRLACQKDDLSGQSLCRQPENQTPVLKFPLTSKGKTTTRKFLIRNIGDQPLKVEDIQPDSTTSQDFKLITSSISLPFTLNSKEEKEVTVEYAPSDDLEDKGQIIVTSNAGNNPNAPVLLEAASRGCNLDVQPRKIDFGGPKSVQVNITNTGNESCVVKRVFLKSGNTEPFALLPSPNPDQTLVPNGSFAFLVKFSPKDQSQQNDFIVIESNDPDEPTIEVELNAKPVGTEVCEIAAVPTTLNYGLIPVGRSRKLSVNIENKGFGDCDVSALNVVGTNPSANTAFQLDSRVNVPLVIGAGKSIRLEVSYTPPAERSGYEGELVINSNDRKNPNYKVKLVGSSGTLCLELVPPYLDFGSSKFGCATPKRTIEVFNLGLANCTKTIDVTGIKLAQNANGEFRINSAPTTPRTLNAGDSIRIDLSYKPIDLGVDTATLDIENNIPGQSPMPVPLVGEGVSTNDQKDVFKQLKQPLTDILFVVDDSGSMGDEQANLSSNFVAFINWAVRLNVDYQIMVTTTDTFKTGAQAPGCARGNPKIVTPSTPNPTAAFAANVKVGTSGSGSEKGLEAAYRALIPPASTGCNKGFYRQDASLSLIFVSDEPDGSPQTVQFYISFFKSLKGIRNLDLIRASVVVGPPPTGCRNPGSGNASSAPRYWEVAKQLKGVQESICSSNWAGTLSNIGSITFGYRTQFFLSRQADPTTIVAKVNGSPVKEDPQDGWQYDATNNSVNFSKTQIPAPGSTVEVQYKAVCLP